MSLLLYFMFCYLIIITTYYFIILDNLDYENLFVIILNFILLILLPLYCLYFKDMIYSLIVSVSLVFSAFMYNLKLKNRTHKNNVFTIIYFLLTIYVLGLITNIF